MILAHEHPGLLPDQLWRRIQPLLPPHPYKEGALLCPDYGGCWSLCLEYGRMPRIRVGAVPVRRQMGGGVRMRKKLKVLSKLEKAFPLGAVLVGLVTLSYTGLALADQGNQSKVLTVDNPNVSCESPVAGPKVEGELGRTIVVSAEDPIDFVTVKSGVGAVVVSAQFDTSQGQITLSKDVSSYVVWTCPPTTPTPPPTETTTTTPPTVTATTTTPPTVTVTSPPTTSSPTSTT
jgi:hypothetical protein